MGRKSKVDRLPEAARTALITWLSDPAWTRADATAALHDLLEELGSDVERPGIDSVNRYAQRFSALLAKQRERHEVAETWIGQFGRLPEGQLGQLIIQMVHGLAFEAGLALEDGGRVAAEDMPALVRMLKDLATTVERTERASSLNARREAEVRAETTRAAAERAADAATRNGLSADGVAALRAAILEQV